jgi:acyl-CoA dehydrogenase
VTAQPVAVAPGRLTSSPGFQEALKIAAQHADGVDREARFPEEAMAALRAAGALGWFVPIEFGGAGATVETLAEAVFELSRNCAATGMIFAMHQIQVGCLVQHGADSNWFADYLRRLTREQRLIASATSEVGTGGDLRRSIAALQQEQDSDGSLLRFAKKASTISYGEHADDLLTTIRRAPEAEPGDQVLILTHLSEMTVRQTGDWDTLGMRGTCSPGFEVSGTCSPEQVLPVPFSTIASETMVPFSHILWAHVWLGLSTDAYQRAQNFVREQARQKPGTTPPSALRLSELSSQMAQYRATVESALREYGEMAEAGGRARLATIGYAVRLNNLKIAASEAAVEACQSALRVCGILGYKNGGPFSIGRHLRDAHSAALMIANDRLHATNASLLLIHREGR